MHVSMLILGTRGDLELFLMLGRELGSRGHRVVLASSAFYEARVRGVGLQWEQIGDGSLEELVSILRSLPSGPDHKRRVESYYRRWVRPQISASVDRIKCMAGAADYFINNLRSVWTRGGEVIPGANVTYDPPGSVGNLAKYAPRLLEREGAVREIVALNKALIDPENRWGDRYRFTGFWQHREPSPWHPSAELVQFLDGGAPPVVVTMGSMVMFDTDDFVGRVVEALRLSGQRGVVVSGWSGLSGLDSSSGTVYCASEIPYDWLFPRASCVIHHGGCGTVAAVLRAGRPSILLPQISSQEHFGEILSRENLVTGVYAVDTVPPDDLAAAIRRALTDDGCGESARHWQKVVAEDPGVGAAADLIEAHRDELG